MWPQSLRLQTLGFRDEQVQSEFSKKENDLNFGCFVKSKILSSDAIQRLFQTHLPHRCDLSICSVFCKQTSEFFKEMKMF